MAVGSVGEPGGVVTVVRTEPAVPEREGEERVGSQKNRQDGWSDWRDLLSEEEEGILRELEELQRKYGEKKTTAPRMTVTPNIYYSSGRDLARIAQAESAQGVHYVMMDIRSKIRKYQALAQQDGKKNQVSRIVSQMNKVLGSGAGKLRALSREETQKVIAKRAQARENAEVLEKKRAERRAQRAEEAYRRQRRSRKGGEYRSAALAGGASGTIGCGGPDGEPAATVTILSGTVTAPAVVPGAGTGAVTGAVTTGAAAVTPAVVVQPTVAPAGTEG